MRRYTLADLLNLAIRLAKPFLEAIEDEVATTVHPQILRSPEPQPVVTTAPNTAAVAEPEPQATTEPVQEPARPPMPPLYTRTQNGKRIRYVLAQPGDTGTKYERRVSGSGKVKYQPTRTWYTTLNAERGRNVQDQITH